MSFKWLVPAAMLAAVVFPMTVKAQTVVAIGNIGKVEDKTPILWGLGGLEIFTVKNSDGGFTPIMRTQVYDARTVEILCRTQAPRLTGNDVHVVSKGGHEYICVRQYLLVEVKAQDASTEGETKSALAHKWAAKLRKVLPAVAPAPLSTGI